VRPSDALVHPEISSTCITYKINFVLILLPPGANPIAVNNNNNNNNKFVLLGEIEISSPRN
jgi:hypothetical protein